MKFYLLPLVAAASLAAACMVSAADGEALFKSKPCVVCHAIDTKLVGPAMKDVAAKYTANDKDHLAGHIKNGSSGVWGPIPMPPNQVTEEEAGKLADWIISLK